MFSNPGKRKRQEDILEHLRAVDERAEEREERLLGHMQQSNTALLGLVERMVSAIEGVSNPNTGQNNNNNNNNNQ